MKVLIVSPFFHPEVCGSSRKMTHLAEDLAKRGHSVTVVTGFPSNPHYQVEGLKRKGPSRLWAKRKHGPVEVIHTFTYVPLKHDIPERILSAVSFMLSAFVFIMFTRQRWDVMVAVSPPFQPLLSAVVGGALRRMPVVCDIQDLYPDIAIETGVIRNRFLIFLSRVIEKFIYTHATALVMISRGFCETAKRLGAPKKRVFLLHNWADEEIFYPRRKDPSLIEELGVQGKVVAIFLGTMGIAQGGMNLIRTAHLLEDLEGLHFLFVGSGVHRENMRFEGRRLGLRNVSFLPLCPNSEVPRYLAVADIGLVHLRKLPVFSMTIPCKTFEYLAMGLPIVMSVEGEARFLVEGCGAGVGAEVENADDLARAIRLLYNDPMRRAECSKAGRAAFLKHFTRRASTRRYERLLKHAACLFPHGSAPCERVHPEEQHLHVR